MIVTRVEAVTKTKYKVYVDGQFAFILYKGELSRFHIAEDQELSQESYEKIRTEVILKRAKLRAMHLLNDMWRTEAQLREKLTRNEYPADIVEAAISYVKSFGYINDYEYARSFIESRKERKRIISVCGTTGYEILWEIFRCSSRSVPEWKAE